MLMIEARHRAADFQPAGILVHFHVMKINNGKIGPECALAGQKGEQSCRQQEGPFRGGGGGGAGCCVHTIDREKQWGWLLKIGNK